MSEQPVEEPVEEAPMEETPPVSEPAVLTKPPSACSTCG